MTLSTKSPRKNAAKSTSERKPQQATRSKLLTSLPESVEHIEIVQQIACVLEELQKRVSDVKAEANNELKKLMKRYESNYKGIEKKVHQVTFDAKKQAQTSMIHLLQAWHEHKEKLPKPLAKEVEKIIENIGAKMTSKKTSSSPAKKTVSTKRAASKTTVKKAAKPRAVMSKPKAKKPKAVKTTMTSTEINPETMN